MQEIKCPNCGKTFVVDDSGYAQIAQQVRDSEFDRALRQRERDIAEAKEKEFELAQMRQKEAFDRALAEAERRVEQLKAQLSGGETEKTAGRLRSRAPEGEGTFRTGVGSSGAEEPPCQSGDGEPVKAAVPAAGVREPPQAEGRDDRILQGTSRRASRQR